MRRLNKLIETSEESKVTDRRNRHLLRSCAWYLEHSELRAIDQAPKVTVWLCKGSIAEDLFDLYKAGFVTDKEVLKFEIFGELSDDVKQLLNPDTFAGLLGEYKEPLPVVRVIVKQKEVYQKPPPFKDRLHY